MLQIFFFTNHTNFTTIVCKGLCWCKIYLHVSPQNSGVFWSPTLAVQADVGTFLTKLASSLPGYRCDRNWLQTLNDRDTEVEEKNK